MAGRREWLVGVRVEFAAPADGDHIAGSIAVQMEADGVTIEPAGEVPSGRRPLPRDGGPRVSRGWRSDPEGRRPRHFGKGQTETTLSLPTGEHTLCLQVGDGVHVATTLTDEITVDGRCHRHRRVVRRRCGRSVSSSRETRSTVPLEEIQPVHADVAALIER